MLKRILLMTLVIVLLFGWTMGISYYSYSAGWDDGSNRVIKTYDRIAEQLRKIDKKKTEEPVKNKMIEDLKKANKKRKGTIWVLI
jgi:hypothetical protein